MIVFLVINSRLRFADEGLDYLGQFGNISAYSPYFRIMEENRAAVSQQPDE